ncbi:pyridine nucleotide-disulfide oxidoreductase [Methyloprofundus sedimenti]|uniref:Pyridine nucleotide-disulfide oxidoreductase n=1 Tax=Methyloprofundus sedimenti TaxID=1420851 RepID=A0A1V8M9A7_9GAMM|nr:FAD-dependent oxidoreductase [Methyloprofundus sedimenti]OQK18108.1 pyridine nucleotide-disulfide oxidoreductase [Methyloprofundus sedimenti]
MSKKYLIVGGVAGGASAAARLRRLGEDDEIIMFEKGRDVSFSNCCLPYHLSGQIKKAENLILMNPGLFKSQYNIEARTNSEVLSIDRANKQVEVKNLVSRESYKEPYDKLILSPGARAIVPSIPGIEKANIFTVRNVVDIDKLNKFIHQVKPSRITVIGGGFIGIEVMENLVEAGHKVSLVEALPQVLNQFDDDMVQILHKEIIDNGVELVLGDKVTAFDTNKVILQSGKEITSEVIVMSIGIVPETGLAKQAGLELGKTGAIKVDSNFLTNDPDIYAVGDAIEVYNILAQDNFKLALAGPALKQARAVADHIHGKPIRNTGYIGSSVVKVFNYNAAATGLNENILANLNIEYGWVEIIPFDRVGIMPHSETLDFKVIFEKPTGRVLGAQAIGHGNVDKRIDVIATAIKFGATVDNLRDLELCYAPPFGTGKDAVNFAGYVASNILHGAFNQVSMSKVRELVEQDAYILDVREMHEYDQAHIKNAKIIPLSQLRERYTEIPKDVPVYVHCRSGQRSYNAVLALQQKGYTQVINISGGFLGVCTYEYFNDVTLGREPIVTSYGLK